MVSPAVSRQMCNDSVAALTTLRTEGKILQADSIAQEFGDLLIPQFNGGFQRGAITIIAQG